VELVIKFNTHLCFNCNVFSYGFPKTSILLQESGEDEDPEDASEFDE